MEKRVIGLGLEQALNRVSFSVKLVRCGEEEKTGSSFFFFFLWLFRK